MTEQAKHRRAYKIRDEEHWAQIRAAAEDGMSFPECAERFDTPLQTITGRARRGRWRRCDLVKPVVVPTTPAAAELDIGATDNDALLAGMRMRLAEAIAADKPGAVRFYTGAIERLERADRTGRGALEDEPPAGEPGPSPWPELARAEQRPPEDEGWRTWLFMGGRGAGKTRAGAEWLAEQAERGGRLALIGPTLHDVREVMIDGPSGLRNLPGRERPRFEASRRRLRWTNGAVAYAFSAEDPESLRGPQFSAAWADEFAVWRRGGDTLALLRMGLRIGARVEGRGSREEDGEGQGLNPSTLDPRPSTPRLVVTTTPRPIAALRRLMAEPGCAVSRSATAENAAHLAPGFLDDLHALYGGTRLAAQELDGLLVEGDAAALWKAEELLRAHGPAPARFDAVVVGVDPPASEGGDACGMVVAGRLGERAYVLEDLTAGGLSPLAWARRAAEAAARWGATRIVAEANQGGDMVRAVLAGAGVGCPVKLVHARSGKRARAEPIAALYEQGRVTHCAPLVQLEEQLMALGGAEEDGGSGSPDRADALVWALTELMLERRGEPRLRVL